MPTKDPVKQAAYKRAFYERNRARYIAESAVRKAEQIKANHTFILEYLEANPCVDCGEADPVVLEFDHRGDKRCSVSDAVRKGLGQKTIAAEIAKCDVRCANCHRRKTAGQFGWKARIRAA